MIDKNQTLKLAKLSMLEFTETELNTITEDLSNIITFASDVQNCAVDCANLKATPEPINAFREDEIVKFDISRDELLQESKTTEDGFFKIPKSIKGR